jgi:hypothetical protein
VLRVTFLAGGGDSPAMLIALNLRFCADGTLRGPDNSVVARCVDGYWHVMGRTHRELNCEGPVRVRIKTGVSDAVVHRGPFQRVHTVNGVLFGDDASLQVVMPGRVSDHGAQCHELALLSPSPG